MPAQPIMADSVDPAEIPAKFDLGNNGVAIYVNGRYAWPDSQVDRFQRHIEISVLPGPVWANSARCIDVERFDATPADVPGFVAERRKNGKQDALVYCSLSVVRDVLAEDASDDFRFWLATLDNFYREQQELAALLRSKFGVTLNPDRIAANQWLNQTHYDQSAWFVPPHWWHPEPGS